MYIQICCVLKYRHKVGYGRMRLTLKDCYGRLNPVCCELLPIYLGSPQPASQRLATWNTEAQKEWSVWQGKSNAWWNWERREAIWWVILLLDSGHIVVIVVCTQLCCVLSSAQGQAAYFPDLI